jgi:hypothetical protein
VPGGTGDVPLVIESREMLGIITFPRNTNPWC